MKNLNSILVVFSGFILFGGSSLAGTTLYRCLDQFGHNVYTDSPTQLTHCGKLKVEDPQNNDILQINGPGRGNIIVAQMGTVHPPSSNSPLPDNPGALDEIQVPSPDEFPFEASPHPEDALDSVSPPPPDFSGGNHAESPSPMMPGSPPAVQLPMMPDSPAAVQLVPVDGVPVP